ncbi:hypothetical protein DM860_017981 [Cuscuta australis]|uniref:Uncharacterized protein n=1 Tax=Cuscuta australis TaxID=267555 RepID=A0A328E0U2_9ASTE|nr:hypothetical protein DM860_017981 [Cuscuta australis]
MKLDVTLFGEHVDMLKSFFQKQPLLDAVIVIQYAKVKTFQGKVVLQNVMYGTRLLLNPDVEEVIAFRRRNSGVGTQRQPLKWTCDDTISSRETEFLDTSRSMVISQLKACLEDGSYVVYGTIVAVNNR